MARYCLSALAAMGIVLAVSSSVYAATKVCVGVTTKAWKRVPAEGAGGNAALTRETDRRLAQSTVEASEPSNDQVTSSKPDAASPASAEPSDADVPNPAHSLLAARRAQARVREVSEEGTPPPLRLDAAAYLKRMLEYEVTHLKGFAAVATGCDQRLTVELYRLEQGFTVFARYSGYAREEKVDKVLLDELPALAQRLAVALLSDVSVSDTINRDNVLRADSEVRLRKMSGTAHLLFGMGTAVRVGHLATQQGPINAAREELRILTPISVHLGYRRKLKAWGLDAFSRLSVGTSSTSARQNLEGGHIDYSMSLLAGLHFLRYWDPSGVNSIYYGGGASFELAVFEGILPVTEREGSSRDNLYGGGLNLDVLLGYEFLRTSSVHFFTQLELTLPAYLLDTEKGDAQISTYLPGGVLQIGVVF